MSWMVAVPLFLASWFFFILLSAGPKAVDEERKGVPEDQRHGVSIAPGFPVFPIIAWALWWNAPPFIADTIVWLHAALLLFSLAMTVYYQIQLRRVHAAKIAEAEKDGR